MDKCDFDKYRGFDITLFNDPEIMKERIMYLQHLLERKDKASILVFLLVFNPMCNVN